MADLPVFTIDGDWPTHAGPVTITLTGNEWVFLSAALNTLGAQPGLEPQFVEALAAAERHIDTQVFEQLAIQRVKEAMGE